MALRQVLLALLAALLMLAGVLFVLRNDQVVQVQLLWFRFAPPLWVLLLGAFGAGALCCGAALALPLWRANMRERRARRALAQTESEFQALRNMPPPPEQGESSGGEG